MYSFYGYIFYKAVKDKLHDRSMYRLYGEVIVFIFGVAIRTMAFYIAAFLTTGAYVPQAVKTWRTRRTGDLSLGMFSMIFLGTVGWLVYGLLRDDLPIILANTITLGTSFVILYFKAQEVRAKRRGG